MFEAAKGSKNKGSSNKRVGSATQSVSNERLDILLAVRPTSHPVSFLTHCERGSPLSSLNNSLARFIYLTR